MNVVDCPCDVMEEKQLHRNQSRESNERRERDCATKCSSYNSKIIVPVVLPTLSCQPPVYNYKNSDWDVYEEIRLRELEEAKARAAQMEKTMRWWSDCTANWREKWSKVQAERNKAREEGRQLKLKLEDSMKELCVLKRINQSLLSENEEMGAQCMWKNTFDPSEMCWIKKEHLGPLTKDPVKTVQNKCMFEFESWCQDDCRTRNHSGDHQDVRINLDLLESEGKCTPVYLENPNLSKGNPKYSQNDETIHISVLHLHLYESKKILQKEQKIRSSLEKEIVKVKSEKSLWKWKYEELQEFHKHGNLKQFGMHNDSYQTEGGRSVENLEEDTEPISQKDMKILKLQAEMERLQYENATSRRRRKILEIEMQELDRENRRLKAKVKELQDLHDRNSELPAVHLCEILKAPHSKGLGREIGYLTA